MNVLVICSMNRGLSPFVKEQVESLVKMGVSIDIFGIKGKGITGYLKNLIPLYKKIIENSYDLIHAHYGLSGLFANLQFKLPVITTFHGSDVNIKSNLKFSRAAAKFSSYNILSNEKLNAQLGLEKNYSVIPCGIDLDLFRPQNQNKCKDEMGLSHEKDYILFSSAFDREVKNASLAIKAVEELPNAKLIELKGYTRQEVACLINASRCVLVTSFSETGPLIVKEALACNKPVVSTDVGDVASIINGVNGSYLVEYVVEDVIQKCRMVLNNSNRFSTNELMKKYEHSIIAERVKEVYEATY